MKTKLRLWCALLCMAALTAAGASEPAFPISGAGSTACVDWNTWRQQDRTAGKTLGTVTGQVLEWVQGFMTGGNAALVAPAPALRAVAPIRQHDHRHA